MTTHNYEPETQTNPNKIRMKKNLFSTTLLATALLLGVTLARAGEHDIDFHQDLPTDNITLIVGVPQTINIGLIGAPGNVTWGFFGAPSFSPPNPACPAPVGDPPNPFICQGITITLPSGSVPNGTLATINWTGTLPSSGALTFTLVVDGHFREYHIDFRRSLDMAFVLDKSGSMELISQGTITRWDALKTAVNNFMLKLTNPAFAKSGDRVGLTFFDDGITPSTFGNSLIPLEPGAATTMQNAMNSLAPGGSTAMGAGLNDAKTKLADATRTRDVLLFTDGEQNVSPLVNNSGCDIEGIAINTNCPVLPSSSGNLKIFTIGIGSPSPTYLSTLQNLATKNGGNCLLTSNGSSFTNTTSMVMGDIDAVFTQAFISLLRNNSPQLVNLKSGIIGTGSQPLIDFPLNKNVADLIIEVALNKNFEIPQLGRLITRGIQVTRNGQDVTTLGVPRWVGSSPNTFVLAFSFNSERALSAKLRSEGQWVVTAQPNSPASGLNYRITVIADDHLLSYTCTQQNAQPSVGGTQTFSVQFSDRGKPIQDATVTATVYKPGDDVGDLMARNALTVSQPNRQADRTAIGILKYNTLLVRDRAFVNALRPTEQVVTLTHKGNGLYEGTYPLRDIAGIYQVLFQLKGNDTIRNTYNRYEMQSMPVQPGPIDLDRSVIDKAVVNGKLVMTVRPVTTYGRFLGPAATDAFDVNATAAKLSSVVDNQDGSYTLTVQSTTRSKGTISILNQKVFTGTLTELKVSKKIPSISRVFRRDEINVLVPNKNFKINTNTIPRVKTQIQNPQLQRIPK
jgi:Mg-chelatase subunit ChlD